MVRTLDIEFTDTNVRMKIYRIQNSFAPELIECVEIFGLNLR